MTNIDINAAEVIRELTRRTDVASQRGVDAMEAKLGTVARQILTRSAQKVPQLFKHLYNSRELRKIPGGWAIEYGGLAATYAEAVHEDTSIVRPGARAGKYIYQYATRRGRAIGSGKLGDPNPPTGWQRQNVHYISRRDSSEIPKVGQHHWLYGAPNSAFDEIWPRGLKEIALAGVRAAQRAVR